MYLTCTSHDIYLCTHSNGSSYTNIYQLLLIIVTMLCHIYYIIQATVNTTTKTDSMLLIIATIITSSHYKTNVKMTSEQWGKIQLYFTTNAPTTSNLDVAEPTGLTVSTLHAYSPVTESVIGSTRFTTEAVSSKTLMIGSPITVSSFKNR